VVLKERAELEEQRQKLVEEVNSNKKLLKGLEDDLLHRLASSTGNLLDDTSLIEVLSSTKKTAAEVAEKLANAAEAEKRIGTAREEYRPVATRGSLLYFQIVDMSAINVMYEVSLQQFLDLFNQSIASSDRAPLASKRILNIIDYLNFHVTCYMQRGLFEKHKTIWTLMLAMRIQTIAGALDNGSVQVLLKGGAALDISNERAKPLPWLPDNVWLNVIQLSRSVPIFRDLPDQINRNDLLWKHWYDDDAPEAQKIPDYDDRVSVFEKLLLVRSMREDRSLLCVNEYIVETLGRRYVDSRPLNLRLVEQEASCTTPIITLLSQGSDPTAAIMDLAKRMKRQVKAISMGQGQEPAARKLIQTGVTQGSWVMLQNCHLGLKFMNELEQLLLRLDEVAPEFKLWITTEPHPKFPIGLLHTSIKLTNEAPAGVRAGLKGSYQWLNQDVLDAVSQPAWKNMLFALCFMHTVVQERRKFGPLGFNIPYEFNQSDLSASVQFMQNHLNDAESTGRPVDWVTVNYMVCEVQYGGRITDDWDRRLFNTYGQAWLAARVLDPQFEFFRGYRIPNAMEIDAYRKYIEELPLIDSPELFGLHSNADLVFARRRRSRCCARCSTSSPRRAVAAAARRARRWCSRKSTSCRRSCRPTTARRRSRRRSSRSAGPSRSTSASTRRLTGCRRSSRRCAPRSRASSSPSRAPSSCPPIWPTRSTRSSSRACPRRGPRSRSWRRRRSASGSPTSCSAASSSPRGCAPAGPRPFG